MAEVFALTCNSKHVTKTPRHVYQREKNNCCAQDGKSLNRSISKLASCKTQPESPVPVGGEPSSQTGPRIPRIYKTESDPDGRQVEFSATRSQMLNGALPVNSYMGRTSPPGVAWHSNV